jgi:hypothetical protein
MRVFVAAVTAAIIVVLWISGRSDGRIDGRGFVLAIALALILVIAMLVRRHRASSRMQVQGGSAAQAANVDETRRQASLRKFALFLTGLSYALAVERWVNPITERATGRGSVLTNLFYDTFGPHGPAVLSFVIGTAFLLTAIFYKPAASK